MELDTLGGNYKQELIPLGNSQVDRIDETCKLPELLRLMMSRKLYHLVY